MSNMTEADWKRLLDKIENPPPPNERLKALLAQPAFWEATLAEPKFDFKEIYYTIETTLPPEWGMHRRFAWLPKYIGDRWAWLQRYWHSYRHDLRPSFMARAGCPELWEEFLRRDGERWFKKTFVGMWVFGPPVVTWHRHPPKSSREN